MSETVSDALCRERQRVQDERFARDKERIEDLEKICEKLNRLSIEMGELIKKHDEELNHQSRRLQVIEQKPLRWWEKFAGAVITALGRLSVVSICVVVSFSCALLIQENCVTRRRDTNSSFIRSRGL